MRFGSVDMFMELGEWDFRMGRPVANEGFLKALLTYGSYDSYEFFCPDLYHMERFSKKVGELINDHQLLDRVKTLLRIALAEAVSSYKYDVFHLGDFTYFMPYLVHIRNHYAKHPFPITGVTHSLDAIHMNLRYVELILSGLAPFDGIVCTSEAAKEAVRKGISLTLERLMEKPTKELTMNARLKKIPLGIDDTYFCESDKSAAREYFRIPEDMVVALSVGRLSLRQKTDWSPILELLAKMFADNEIENLILIIAGGAEESDISLLESLISRLGLEQKVILFPNFLPEVKSKLYQAADIYISIVDNFQETFGLNIIEAMASGLPVVCSDFSGYRDLVMDGENGFLIPTTWCRVLPSFLKENMGILDPSLTKLCFSQLVAVDLGELKRAVTTLYNDTNLRTKMGLTARRTAQAYRWKRIIRLYEALWFDLSKEAREADTASFNGRSDILVGVPEKIFSHYPSRIISDDDFVTLTEVGRRELGSGSEFIRYDDVSVCLFSELETFILKALKEGGMSAGSIKKEAIKMLEAEEGQVESHLLWLLKHGAVILRELKPETMPQ